MCGVVEYGRICGFRGSPRILPMSVARTYPARLSAAPPSCLTYFDNFARCCSLSPISPRDKYRAESPEAAGIDAFTRENFFHHKFDSILLSVICFLPPFSAAQQQANRFLPRARRHGLCEIGCYRRRDKRSAFAWRLAPHPRRLLTCPLRRGAVPRCGSWTDCLPIFDTVNSLRVPCFVCTMN